MTVVGAPTDRSVEPDPTRYSEQGKPRSGAAALSKRREVGLLIAVSLVVGGSWTLFCFGPKVIAPSQVGWLLHRPDPATYYIGWLFYRHEAWHFPVGLISEYLAPFGTSICLTDSIPLLAIPLKIFSRMLPEVFQYFGIWIVTSCALQAMFGYLLLTSCCGSRWVGAVGALLFLGSPAMMYKQGDHIALASHWVILWALWLYFRPAPSNRGRGLLRWLGPVGATALLHPYLAVMTAGLMGAWLLRMRLVDRCLRWTAVLGTALGVGIVVIGLWWLSGYFVSGEAGAYSGTGSGDYSLNLNSLINPGNRSSFLKARPDAVFGQYEGYGYLGLGLLVAAVLACGLLAVRRPSKATLRELAPVAIVSLLFAGFALSHRITFDDHALLTLPNSGPLATARAVFRASGRFVWPLYYLLITGVLWTIACRGKPRLRPWLLAAVLLVQAADVLPSYQRRSAYAQMGFEVRLSHADWNRAGPSFERLIVYPPGQVSIQFGEDYRDLSLWAAQRDMSVTTGYAARPPERQIETYRAELERVFRHGQPDPRALYILSGTAFTSLGPAMADRFLCTLLDGYIVCHDKRSHFRASRYWDVRQVDLGDYLAGRADRVIIGAVKDDATAHLDEALKGALRDAGAEIDRLAFRGSYAFVLQGDRVAAQWLENSAAIHISKDAGTVLGNVRLAQPLSILSAGFLHGNRVSIQIGANEYALGGRGLNLVILDSEQNVAERACFDFAIGERGVAVTPATGSTIVVP